MAMSKRGNRYRAEFVLQGTRYIRTFEDEQAAMVWESYVRLQVSLGRPVDDPTIAPNKQASTSGKMTFKEALKAVLASYKGNRDESGSARNAEDVVEYFGENKALADVTSRERDAFIDSLRSKGLAAGTINRKLAALSKMVKLAREDGEPVALMVKQLKESEGRIRFLTAEEEAKVLEDIFKNEGEAYHDFVALALDTGCRLTELLLMEHRWVRKANDGSTLLSLPGYITKNGKTRTIELTDRAQAILAKHSDGERVWPKRWHKHTISHMWSRMRERLKLQDDAEFVFHACRHTCATRLLEATGNLVLVKDWLGHSDIRVTNRYAKLVASTVKAGAKALNQWSAQSGSKVADGVKQGGGQGESPQSPPAVGQGEKQGEFPAIIHASEELTD